MHPPQFVLRLSCGSYGLVFSVYIINIEMEKSRIGISVLEVHDSGTLVLSRWL